MNPPVANDPLAPVAEEFLIRFRDGDRPSVSDYAQRFPDLAARITQEFPLLAARELLRSRSVRDRAGYAANDEDAESAFQAGDELDATARQASAFGNELSDPEGDGDQGPEVVEAWRTRY